MATLITTPIKTFVSGETVTPAKLNELGQSTVALTAATIVDADVSASAAIAYSKLAALDSANILVGNGSNVATKVAVTGDVTISNAGVTAIGNNKVVTAMIVDGSVTAPKVANGMVVSVLQKTLTAVTTTTAQIPSDNTKPQIGEGTEILSQAITPASATNKVLCRVSVPYASNSSIRVGVALFRVGTADALASVEAPSNNSGQVSFEFLDSPASATEITYSVRVGNQDGASTVGVCGQASAAATRLHGGSCMATLTLTEIKAS